MIQRPVGRPDHPSAGRPHSLVCRALEKIAAHLILLHPAGRCRGDGAVTKSRPSI
jgi:hypothetical protein